MAAFGSVAQVALIWSSIDIVNAGLLAINLYGLALLAPRMRRALEERVWSTSSAL
jgi:Na+/alanine symporter